MAGSNEARGAGARLVRTLQCIAEGEREFSLKTLAERLNLPASTVHRLLQLLVRTGMVERAGSQAYRAGRELFRMSSLVIQKFDVRNVARPLLRELWTQWQETCVFCLYRPADRTAMVAEVIPSPHALQLVMEPMANISLAWGSLGRSILAQLPREDIEAVLAEMRRGPLTGRTPPSRTRLREELNHIRRVGYAIYEDRSRADIAGVAAPVFGPAGEVAGCIGIVMPASRFEPSDRSEMSTTVALRAQRISAALGGGHKPRGTS